MTFRSLLRLASFSLCLAVSGVADTPPSAAEPALELPKYVVTDQLKLPKPESWRYARVPGFEVISCASASATRRFLEDFQMLQQVIDITWPALRQAASPVPTTLVLYGGGREPNLLEAAVKVSGDDVLAFEPLGAEEDRWRRTSVFNANNEGACIVVDLQSPAVGMADSYRQFYRAYVLYLFSRLEGRTSPWLREGLARLLAGVEFSDKWIKFGTVDAERGDDFMKVLARPPMTSASNASDRTGVGNNAANDPVFGRAGVGSSGTRAPLQMGAFPSLAQMLQADDATFRGDRWSSYLAHAFVHMCLYGRGQQFQKPFLLYVARSDGGPGSESLFQECFGMSVKKMEAEIASYVSFADYKSVTYKADKKGESLVKALDVPLREATQAEVGRIKGEGLILAGRRDLARAVLLAPFVRGQQDADLLASLGLYELDAGRPERVRSFLELAARGGTTRARAYLELARLRGAGRVPAGDSRPDSPPEAVLAPLRSAAALEPPQIEVYELLAQEWLKCATPPPAGDLALLEKGAVRFQRKLKLVYDTARLFAAAGNHRQAARLAEWGMKSSPAARDKERFAQLLATLPAAAAGKQ